MNIFFFKKTILMKNLIIRKLKIWDQLKANVLIYFWIAFDSCTEDKLLRPNFSKSLNLSFEVKID